MQQGGGVDELDDRRQDVGIRSYAARGARCQQGGRRPQALATRVDDVAADVVDQGHLRGQPSADHLVDLQQVGRNRVQQGLEVHSGAVAAGCETAGMLGAGMSRVNVKIA